MTINEWQEKFLSVIYDQKMNIFPPAMIKLLSSQSEAEAEEFKKFVMAYFNKYESLTISVSGKNSELRKLFLSLEDVKEEVPEEEEDGL